MRRFRRRDRRFILLVLLNAICMVGFLASGIGTSDEKPGGWRRVDLNELKARIQSGRLVDREADWYRTVPEELEH